jgi:hypothetical protein
MRDARDDWQGTTIMSEKMMKNVKEIHGVSWNGKGIPV